MDSTAPSIPAHSMSAPPLEKTAATPRTEWKSLQLDGVVATATLANGERRGKENSREGLTDEPNPVSDAADEVRGGEDAIVDGLSTSNGSQPADKFPPGPSEILSNPLLEGLDLGNIEKGILIPLKTVLEVRADHAVLQAYITRAPTKCASDVMDLLRTLLPAGNVKNLPHLRRCAKPGDLPAHLKTQFMNDSPLGRQVHTGKSTWLYIILGDVREINQDHLLGELSKIDGIDVPFITQISVPANPPTSQIHAAMWTSQFWPTLYRKNNPLGPHPSMVARSTEEIKHDASLWMTLAHQVAQKARGAGIGEAMGACIVQREDGKAQLLAVAGDARWHQEWPSTGTGNPMAHCALRAISMVAQKLVRHERRAANQPTDPPALDYDPFQDLPLLDEERVMFDEEHPNPDGYLCHGLELYLTHEPCVQCSMGILHSRMGKVVFAHRQTLTGGLCSEDRGHGHPELSDSATGEGLGLFWRRELNWSLLAWEWEPIAHLEPLPAIPPIMHP